ncbi:aminoacyl-tRNA deacylase [Amnibacterium endophyticum]|uniref:Aminoacyl-tRNA deacylase n=1 Tax=Amnibacterium endophyticum TaxID=2109337 RepID=A0ABW4LFY7_9MICO
MGTERVVAAAERLGIDVEVVQRPAADSREAAAALLGLPPSGVVKSLVVGRSDGTFLFALVPGDRQIAWAGLRAAVGVNRLRLPSADEAREATGYERGTITPLGSAHAWPVFADERIAGRIAMGAGEHGFSAFVDAAALLAALDATVADISA